MSRIYELIDGLPKAYRDIAAIYVPELEKMSDKQIAAWVDGLVDGRSKEAYDALTDRLSPEQLVFAIKVGNQRLRKLNKETATEAILRRQILKDVLLATILLLKGA